MQQNHTSRFAVIIGVLIVALYMIFPQPRKLFDPNLRFWEKTNLKPGIDMVGGTSLTYEIRPAQGSVAPADLATQTMVALKKRVDPQGILNLIWRPQGATRLEIQMPLSDYSGTSKTIRDNFIKAQRQLEAANVRPADVIAAVENFKGDEREAKLKELAAGSDKRATLYGALRAAFDQRETAKTAKDYATAAQADVTYDELKKQLDADSVTAQELQAILDLAKDVRDKRLATLRKQNAGEPRLAAIDQYVAAYDEYNKIKGSLDDAGDLKRLLKGSGVLEFHILVSPQATDGTTTIDKMRERLQAEGPAVQAGDTMRWFAFDRDEDARGGGVVEQYNGKFWALAWITDENSMVNRDGQEKWVLEKASPQSDDMGSRVVGFRFDLVGARFFSRLTREENKDKLLSVMLDDKIISAANINATIGREGIISRGDGYSNEEYEYLINTLNAGSLPAQLADEPISERTVGPQLGEANLREGLIACAMGLVIVAIFLTGYYYLAGLVAFIAVLMNVILIFGVMAMFNATFTLPGVAGIVLSIGAAVDANVLIFERLREEQQRGLSLKLALQHAYDRAFSAIVDSNATTMITSVILIWLGSEEVKGFGVTLLIGLVASLFTSLYVTRAIFNLLVDKFQVRNLGSLPLSFPKWDKMLHPHVDWMKYAPIAMVVSGVLIVVGLAATAYQYQQRRLLDIEFAAGTAVQFELKDSAKMPAEQVRELLKNKPELPALGVVSVGDEDKVYEIVTPNNDSRQVRDAILAALGDKLNIIQPSNFASADKTADTVIDQAVLPIKADFAIDGFKPAQAANYQGGVAIVLRNLSPKLPPRAEGDTGDSIEQRIENQRLTAQTGAGASTIYTDFKVVSPLAGNQPTDTAVVLVAPGNFPFDKDPAKWRDELAGPNWRLVQEALTRPPTLQKVSNIQPSVAGDTQRDAVMALVLSVIVIMAYIWLRFGNLKYGTATVVAMLHDTLMVIGAIGISHFLAEWGIGRALLIEEGFRINLTMVAAILTVMSFSMLDTIVVFDRIRENRGKYGHLSRRVVNDSINQTMSRTLLTAGTTVVTLVGMYIMGGPAIHGFTFVLFIGILVGTYSSITIAAPILLAGGEKEKAPAGKTVQAGQLSKANG